jgi:hypothetical protein
MHANHFNKKHAGDGNPTAGQHTNGREISLRFSTMASDWHRMDDGYSVAFSIKAGQVQSTWNPGIPPARKLRRIVESGKYFVARHAFMLEVSARIGGTVLCVDLGGRAHG